MSEMDSAIVVGFFALLGTIVTALAGVAGIIYTHRRETKNTANQAADTAADKVAEEKEDLWNLRMKTRDERITNLEDEIKRHQAEIERLRSKLEKLSGQYRDLEVEKLALEVKIDPKELTTERTDD